MHGSYNGDLAKLRKMVQLSHVSWDVVEVEAPELARGCEEGLFEPLDASLLGDVADYLPGAVQPCGVGIFVWSTVLAYNGSKLKGAPQGWADFWDTQRFPGKRGLRWGAKYNLEFALMADGVPAKDRVPRAGQRRGPGSRLPQARPAQAAAALVAHRRGADPPAR